MRSLIFSLSVLGLGLWSIYVYENRMPEPVTVNQESKVRTQEVKYINACRVKGDRVAIIYIDTVSLDMDYRCVPKQLHTVANGCDHGKD